MNLSIIHHIAIPPKRVNRPEACEMTFFHDPDGLPLELHE